MIIAAVAVALCLLIRNNVHLHFPGTQGGGITALAHMTNEDGSCLIFCGTKKGTIRILSLIDEPTTRITTCTEYNVTNGKYPIFSLTVNEDDRTLFCGGSDRFVTILQYANADQHDTKKNEFISFKQRLGPHTGWVQDVFFVSPDRLYSIGCNCIETWQKQPNQEWKQGKRWVIDSDTELGCTLSSDLLCLACTNDCLLAGGVDGRIHVFAKESIPRLQHTMDV